MSPILPGSDCDVYLRASELEILTDEVKGHLRGCPWCARMRGGDPEVILEAFESAVSSTRGDHHPRSTPSERETAMQRIVDDFLEQQEFEKRFVETPKVSRRGFMMRTTASIVALAAAGFGIHSWVDSKPGPISRFDANEAVAFADLDTMLAQGGVVRIQQVLSTAPLQKRLVVLRWILDRQLAIMYPDVVSCLADPDVEIRMRALNTLTQLPPIDLKNHVVSIQAAELAETDPYRKRLLVELLSAINRS